MAPSLEDWTPIGLDPVDWPDPDHPSGGFTRDTWAAWKREHPNRCRDCGTRKKLNAGGSDGPGPGIGFVLCDDCAAIDRCEDRHGDGTHVSHYGYPHTRAEHDQQVAARDRRRRSYLRTHQRPAQAALF